MDSSLRPEVQAFLELAPLPPEEAEEETIALIETALHRIAHPVSDAEAEALLAGFGDDDCFGLAWTLLHLIETSPTPFPQSRPPETANPWHHLLFERIP